MESKKFKNWQFYQFAYETDIQTFQLQQSF